MKKKFSVLALALLLVLALGTPVMAANQYGVIYDETEELNSPGLAYLGETVLPQVAESCGLDLRVDILTSTDYDSVGDAAVNIYSNYDYGYGEKREGVTLTILLEMLDNGSYALPSEVNWCVYAILDPERGSGQELSDYVFTAVQPYMAETAWNGEDMTMSAVATAQAVSAMADAVETYILTHCPPDSSAGDGETGSEAPAPQSVTMHYVYDISGLLSFAEWEELEAQAEAISQRSGCGVYAVMLDDYTEYGEGDVFDVTTQIYHSGENSFGVGSGRDGIILLLSMDERDFALFVYGEKAEYAFNSYGQKKLEDAFLDDFGENDWYGGISDYLDECDEFLAKADAGKPVRPNMLWGILLMVGISCLISLAVCAVLKRKMNTVHQKVEANEYIGVEGLVLTDSYDNYTHTTETRTRIAKASSSGGGSSSSSRSGGGGSGRSGKF